MNLQKKKHDILVILPIQRDKEALAKVKMTSDFDVKIHYLEDDHFEYDRICETFDVVAYVKRAIDYVIQNDIDGVIYSHDMASLVAGAVCEKTGLVGPSLESVFLACHKYYSRQKDSDPVSFQALNIHDFDLKNLKIKYPCYVKAPCLMCSHLQFIAKNEEEMTNILSIMKEELRRWGGMFFDFFQAFIPKDKYPLAHEHIVLIEELVTDYSQCAIEGWVDGKGGIHIWAMSDINYHDNQRRAQNCYSMPTSTSPDVQAQLAAITTQVVSNHGLRSGFFNVDVWHWHGKKPCKVIEVNGRAASLYHIMHRKCFSADLYKAMLYLCLGRDLDCYLESPLAKPNEKKLFGALFFLVTFGKGPASEFLDFENLEKMRNSDEVHGVEIYVQPGSEIRDNGTAGFRMGKFYIFGSSYEEINQKANQWRSLVVKNKHLSPYGNL